MLILRQVSEKCENLDRRKSNQNIVRKRWFIIDEKLYLVYNNERDIFIFLRFVIDLINPISAMSCVLKTYFIPLHCHFQRSKWLKNEQQQLNVEMSGKMIEKEPLRDSHMPAKKRRTHNSTMCTENEKLLGFIIKRDKRAFSSFSLPPFLLAFHVFFKSCGKIGGKCRKFSIVM